MQILVYDVRGQYAGYQDVKGVKPNSTTETFVALRLFINSWRWGGVRSSFELARTFRLRPPRLLSG